MPDDKCILDPERDCIGKLAAAKLEARIDTLERWQEESRKFHCAFYDWQREQIARDSRLDVKLGSMENDLKKLVSWQDAQRDKPGKQMDAVVEKIVMSIVAAVIGFILAQVGL